MYHLEEENKAEDYAAEDYPEMDEEVDMDQSMDDEDGDYNDQYDDEDYEGTLSGDNYWQHCKVSWPFHRLLTFQYFTYFSSSHVTYNV